MDVVVIFISLSAYLIVHTGLEWFKPIKKGWRRCSRHSFSFCKIKPRKLILFLNKSIIIA